LKNENWNEAFNQQKFNWKQYFQKMNLANPTIQNWAKSLSNPGGTVESKTGIPQFSLRC